MDWFILAVYVFPIIIILAVAITVLKYRSHHKAHEENLHQLHKEVANVIDNKEKTNG